MLNILGPILFNHGIKFLKDHGLDIKPEENETVDELSRAMMVFLVAILLIGIVIVVALGTQYYFSTNHSR